jgi:hypothetical protein
MQTIYMRWIRYLGEISYLVIKVVTKRTDQRLYRIYGLVTKMIC